MEVYTFTHGSLNRREIGKMEYQFYKSRIEQAPKYGFVAGHDIIRTVCRCAFNDSSLTLNEFDSIINLCERAHIKMMEDNYNAGWNQ